MIFLKLNPPNSLLSKASRGSAAFGFVLLALLVCPNSMAQTGQQRPVARMIGYSVGDPRDSRARKAPAGEVPAANTKAGHVTSPSIDEATPIERRAFEKANQARVENGLPRLVWDSELCRMAREHSESMGRLRYFSHETPDGSQVKDRARSFGILHFKVLAENIAYNKGYEDPGAFAVERWLLSSAHRANILYDGFQASATGSYVSSDGSVYLTEVFITR